MRTMTLRCFCRLTAPVCIDLRAPRAAAREINLRIHATAAPIPEPPMREVIGTDARQAKLERRIRPARSKPGSAGIAHATRPARRVGTGEGITHFHTFENGFFHMRARCAVYRAPAAPASCTPAPVLPAVRLLAEEPYAVCLCWSFHRFTHAGRMKESRTACPFYVNQHRLTDTLHLFSMRFPRFPRRESTGISTCVTRRSRSLCRRPYMPAVTKVEQAERMIHPVMASTGRNAFR